MPIERDSQARGTRQAVVRLRNTSCGRTGISTGSGFAISPTQIVTNRHVVENASDIQVNTWDGTSIDARVTRVARQQDGDLAVISIDEPLTGTLPLSDTPVVPGQHVRVVGFPEGNAYNEAGGEVIGLVPGVLDQPGESILVDAVTKHGNSGGPLLDANGRVVGVVFAGDEATDDGFALPVSTLRGFLEAPEAELPQPDPVDASC